MNAGKNLSIPGSYKRYNLKILLAIARLPRPPMGREGGPFLTSLPRRVKSHIVTVVILSDQQY